MSPFLSCSFQSVDTSFVESDSGKVSTRYEFQPAVGTHLMRYGGTWIKGRTDHPKTTAELDAPRADQGCVVSVLYL